MNKYTSDPSKRKPEFALMNRTSSTHEDNNTVVQMRMVNIHNFHGEKLVGVLHDTGSKHLVILCHGYRSCKDRIPVVNLAYAYGDAGLSAFRFDFAGNGDSEGSFQYGNYRREVDDLRAVMEYFWQEQFSIAAIIGHSKGGNVVLLYASTYKDIPAVVNISGRFNMERGIEGRLGKDFLRRIKEHGFIDVKSRKGKIKYRVTDVSLMDRLTTDTRGECQLIPQSCRVLTIHGSADEIVPVEDAMEFAKLIANHKLHIIDEADHEYTSHQDELVSVVLNFVRESSHQGMFMPTVQPSSKRDDKLVRSRF